MKATLADIAKVSGGRGAAGKVPVFGLLKRHGKVYAKVIQDVSAKTLIPIIERKVLPHSIVYSDSWQAYNALDVSAFHHHRVDHGETFVDEADRLKHINGIENFWSQAKRRLRKYNGIPKEHFPLFLKECEFRFNAGSPAQQLRILKAWKKKHEHLI